MNSNGINSGIVDGWSQFSQDLKDHGWLEDAPDAADEGEFPPHCVRCGREYGDHVLLMNDGAMACFAVCLVCDQAEEYLTL